MKTVVALAALVCTCAVMGLESMKTDFSKPEDAKFWVLDGSPANFPGLKYGYDAEKKVFAVDNTQTKKNVYFKSPGLYVDAKQGDVIHVRFEACGEGQTFVIYECISNKKWVCMGKRSKEFKLTPDWTVFEADLEVKDGKLPTTQIMMDFCIKVSGKIMVRSFSAEPAKK